MPRLSGTRDGHVQATTVDTAAGPLNVRYIPERLTIGDITGLQTAMDEGGPIALQRATNEVLARVLVGWDLTDDNDVELPVTVEVLEQLPVAITVAISSKLGEVMRPPTNGRPSADGS